MKTRLLFATFALLFVITACTRQVVSNDTPAKTDAPAVAAVPAQVDAPAKPDALVAAPAPTKPDCPAGADSKDSKKPCCSKPEMSPEQQEMMKKFEAYATPGPEHQLLAGKAGSWDYTVKMWCSPDAPPSESAGTSESRLVLGGRFLKDKVTGSFNGQPFEGVGVTGYDNIKKKYVATWIDSMGTGMMIAEGAASADGKTLTFTSEFSCPITGGARHAKTVETLIDADHWTMEMYDSTPDGKEFKMMQINYTRCK